MNSTPIMTDADALELAEFRRKARRNAARRAHRAANRGEGFAEMVSRLAAHAPDYARDEGVTLAELQENVVRMERALAHAVVMMVEDRGYSWSQIGRELGVTREAARQRFGKFVKSTRTSGGQPAELR